MTKIEYQEILEEIQKERNKYNHITIYITSDHPFLTFMPHKSVLFKDDYIVVQGRRGKTFIPVSSIRVIIFSED